MFIHCVLYILYVNLCTILLLFEKNKNKKKNNAKQAQGDTIALSEEENKISNYLSTILRASLKINGLPEGTHGSKKKEK